MKTRYYNVQIELYAYPACRSQSFIFIIDAFIPVHQIGPRGETLFFPETVPFVVMAVNHKADFMDAFVLHGFFHGLGQSRANALSPVYFPYGGVVNIAAAAVVTGEDHPRDLSSFFRHKASTGIPVKEFFYSLFGIIEAPHAHSGC